MNALINRLTNSTYFSNSSKHKKGSIITCNYANNYYGDQVCFQVKPAKPRNNLHVAIQL